MDNFPLTDEQREKRLQAFIDSIDPNDICKLASQHNSSKTCRMFRDHAHGSFNVCYFVEFEDGIKWVVRIPLVPCISKVWDKVQSEVATICYLEAKTTIPVSHIHAFGRGGTVDEKNSIGYTYIIQSYIVGQPLNLVDFRFRSLQQRVYFYSQLIDILAQLYQQELPYAGSLIPDPDGGTNPHIGPLLSIQLNELQCNNPSLVIITTPRDLGSI